MSCMWLTVYASAIGALCCLSSHFSTTDVQFLRLPPQELHCISLASYKQYDVHALMLFLCRTLYVVHALSQP